MTTAQWALVIGSVFGPGGLVLAAAAWLRAETARQQVTAHVQVSHGENRPHSAL